jgi:minor extracellular serine protease Vpr
MLRKLVVLIALIALAMPASALAAPNQQESITGYAIVTLADPPIASYEGGKPGLERTKPLRGRLDPTSPAYLAYQAYLANERAAYRAFLAQRLPQAQVVAEYDTVLNGVAVKLNGVKLSALANYAKVRAVDSSWLYRPTMNVSVDVIGATGVWPTVGGQASAGAGIKVGVIDSGIDSTHDFFACKDGIQAKVYGSGDAGGTQNVLVSDHGTHVAGTIGGCAIELTDGPITGTISGVAPGAVLFDYNVFPGFGGGYIAFGGSAFAHDIARALEDAVNDGMHVVNLSLSGGVQGPHDFLSEAINATADAGVVPAVAAGNAGPGAGTIGSPGNAEKALTAGATTNPHYIGIEVVVADTDTYGAAVGEFDPFAVDPVTDADFVSWGGDELACSTGPAGSVSGAVVLIKRGTCTFSEKVATAHSHGAIGVVVYNNVGGDPIAMGGTGAIPAVMVSLDDGTAIKAGLPSTVTIDGSTPVEVTTENADIMAGFSSRGPGPFLNNIKPDVTAPGVNVYSSVFDNKFEMFQGTSMATPHVAGAAALLLQDRPDLSPADVKSLLGNNAERDVWADVVGGTLAGVMDRGGGRIDLVRAFDAETTFDPMSLSFGSHNGNRQVSESITVEVWNLSETSKTYSITTADPNLSLSTEVLMVAAGATGTFTVTLSVRGGSLSEGDVSVSDGTTTHLIPFWYSTGN